MVNGYEVLVDNDFVLNPARSQPPSAAGGSVSLSPHVPPLVDEVNKNRVAALYVAYRAPVQRQAELVAGGE